MNLRAVKKHGSERAVAIDVYRELRRSRDYVGRLEKTKNGFLFAYHESYLLKENALSLGPDLPLQVQPFRSKELFISFEDRLPSKRNPAYPEYCKHCNISPDEDDPMVLLSTIGRRGPSCLIFEGVVPDTLDAQHIKEFRQKLNLTIREFALLFDISTAALQNLEKKPSPQSELIKRLRIYMTFPQMALWEIERNRAKVHDQTYDSVVKVLQSQNKNGT